MKPSKKGMTILMAEDDPDDRLLTREAFDESGLVNDLVFVQDGEELMDYLYRRGPYEALSGTPLPGLILLDLNMPRKDGKEALKEIKQNEDFRRIPVVIMTTSKEEEDVMRSYDLGANSYIVKPFTFESMVEVMGSLSKYWFEIVDLPMREQ